MKSVSLQSHRLRGRRLSIPMKSFNLQSQRLGRGRLVILMKSFNLQSHRLRWARLFICMKSFSLQIHRLRRVRLFIHMISFSLQRQPSIENQHVVSKIVESRNEDKQHHHRSHWRAISLYFLSMETAALRQPYGVQNSTVHTSASNRSHAGGLGASHC